MLKKSFKFILIAVILFFLVCTASYAIVMKQKVNIVTQWTEVVKEATQKEGISDYSDLVLAIILTETKGGHLDVMQSSESKYGVQNQIVTSEESIESGVAYLAEMIHESQVQQTDIWTAIQAYNFGPAYIHFVAENGGVNTTELAEEYSKDFLAPMLGNHTQMKYHYLKPRAIFYNGGYLYQDGGNFFYADIVARNMKLMHIFTSF